MELTELSDDEPVLFSITDNVGLPYRVKFFPDDYSPQFFVYDQQVKIGHAYCQVHGKTLYLADICISDAAYVPCSRFKFWLRWLFRVKPPTRDYCGHGLGSALLRLFIDKAREGGFHEITGEVKRSDPRVAPTLLDWYRRYGFTVTPGEGKPNVIASLRMKLTS